MGGSSLLVTRVVAAVALDFGIELPVRDFFANPTIASISDHIDRLLAIKQGHEPNKTTPSNPHSVALRNKLPTVLATMIGGSSGSLFTVRYEPKKMRRKHGVVICNSLGHEHARAYRNLQQLALLLAEKGFDVVRFDYRGTGNSTGKCESITANTLVEDTRTIADYLRLSTRPQRMTLLGIRFGATVAANAGVNHLDQLILWDPVIEGSQFIRLLDRFHEETLVNQTRFSRVLKRSGRDQAYGHAFNEQKRQSLSQLCLSAHASENGCDQQILVTHGYSECEPGFESLSGKWNLSGVEDHIGWDRLDYAERAFSSPASFQMICSLLERGTEKGASSNTVSLPSISLNLIGGQQFV